MQDDNLNSGTPIFKIRILAQFVSNDFTKVPPFTRKRFYFKRQTHIEHSSAEMNTSTAWDSLLLAKVSKLPHHPMQIPVNLRVRVFGKASLIQFNEFASPFSGIVY